MSTKRGVWIAKFMVMGLVALGLIGLVTQTLWNWLVPELFSGPVISFWQALGLLVLSKILFWTFGKGHGYSRHRHGGPWGYYWSQKWSAMSPEDRERFKQKMNEKWCSRERAPSQDATGVANG